MKKTITLLMLVLCFLITSIPNFGQCDQEFYTDLSGPCATSVCGYDPYCCNVEWDNICAGEAASDPSCAYCWADCHDNDLDNYTNCDGDCDDFDDTIHPGAYDICGNGIDEDCDGSDNTSACDAAGYSNTSSICGVTVCSFDPFCCVTQWDNICASEATIVAECQFCWCNCYDNDVDGFTNCDGDCDDFDDAVYPGATEICNNIDDDCNGIIDDGFTVPYYRDLDGDGYGSPIFMVESCIPIVGYVLNNLDCDDTNFFVNPSIGETCSNEVDDNCDGFIDNSSGSCDVVGYADLAGPCGTSVCAYDDFCCNTAWDIICAGEAASDANCSYCVCGCYDNDMDGYTNCDGDCDDFNPAINPGEVEICSNELDDDCSNLVDDVSGSCDAMFYNDLAGPCATAICAFDNFCCNVAWDLQCAAEAAADINCSYCVCGCYDNDMDGYTNCDGDCNDFNDAINPGATEVCDEIDNNCDGNIDEGVQNTYYLDEDGDGFGTITSTTFACSLPPGYSTDASDCDDSNILINPLGTETCNGIDDDCSNGIDDGVQNTYYFDDDGDGYGDPGVTTLACTTPPGYVDNADDCDDSDASINPDAEDICDNGIDENCDGFMDNTTTACDRLGYSDLSGPCATLICTFDSFCCSTEWDNVCAAEAMLYTECQYCWCGCYDNDLDGYTNCDGDCNDFNGFIYPGATEFCDSQDNDCDGSIDEGLTYSTYYMDDDGDGYGDPNVTTIACAQPFPYSANNLDCDDSNSAIRPFAPEVCNNIDDDCDGSIDEGVQNLYYADADGDGYGDPLVSVADCNQPIGYVTDNSDCDDGNDAINVTSLESCNGADDNCDGNVDEGLPTTTYYEDADGDGYGNPSSTIDSCSAVSGYVNNDEDCDDTDSDVNPDATETCNTIDDDCDGDTDEGVLITFYADTDSDGYGDASATVQDCSPPSGYVTDDTDCDDTDGNIFPGAQEFCGNGVDDDCDGDIDEVGLNIFFADADGDGYGDPSNQIDACIPPVGYVTDDTDCDDSDENVNPGMDEVCGNGTDDDCDGDTDEVLPLTYYADSDGDGYGDATQTLDACTQPLGYVSDDTDCDDADENVNPGVDEVCNNGLDDNCDGNTDDIPTFTFYADVDGDGYGDPSSFVVDCTLPSGYVTDDTDCDDADENVNPGATEVCGNGTDDDCDGDTDEVGMNTYFADADGDGYGDASNSTMDCTQPLGYVSDDTDCDDADENVNPGVDEVCNNALDDNCDGNTDDIPTFTFYADMDGDGYGDPSSFVVDCTLPSGYVTDDTDCDDADENVNP
ncbi:MAG: putative metal-binding motif-containing protein, partial [Flavobacteriales bacterium]|nr:putative metal-binding motif-containing protein [Flavobacteriales bacterium]